MAPFMPPYHLSHLALGTIGPPMAAASCSTWRRSALFTIGFLTVAGWGYRRDEGRTYG